MEYSYLKGILNKFIIPVILFGIPLALQLLPSKFLDITIGGLLYLIYNRLKFFYVNRA